MGQFDTLTIVTTIILGVVCVALGLVLGALPLKTHEMTREQNKAASILSFIVAMVFLALMLGGQDLSTWVMLITLAIGFGVGKIPPVHAFFIRTWPFFEPRKPQVRRKRR